MLRPRFFLSSLAVLAAGVVAACAASEEPIEDDGGGGSDGGAGAATSTSTSGGSGPATVTVGSGGGEAFIAEVYGHSPEVLYKLDATTNQVTVVGPFSGCTDVIDIAIDKNNDLVGTAQDGLYAIDRDTASCTLIKTGTYPNSLSFVPEGVLDAGEVLVGYNVTDYVRIDRQTGTLSTVLAGALESPYQSSGDIVSVEGGGTFLTIKGGECNDCIVEVDPATGAIVKSFGSVGIDQVFGLAFWGGSAYGFSNDGTLFQIIFGDNSVTTTAIAVSGAPADLKFWGAGSSTQVPLEPPQ